MFMRNDYAWHTEYDRRPSLDPVVPDSLQFGRCGIITPVLGQVILTDISNKLLWEINGENRVCCQRAACPEVNENFECGQRKTG